MRVVKEVINFGTSLGIVLDKVIKDTLKLEKGDILDCNFRKMRKDEESLYCLDDEEEKNGRKN